MKTIRVLIGESNQLMSCGLTALFESCPNVQMLGRVDSSQSMIEKLHALEIDVLLLNFTASGFSVDDIRSVIACFPNVKVVAITPEQSSMTVLTAIKAGVHAYVKTDCSLDEITGSVMEVSQGRGFFCGEVLAKLRLEEVNQVDIESSVVTCDPVSISIRENEVITMIAEGYTNGQIADRLFLSSHTVNTHRKNIMNKLGVKNTAAVVMYAVKSGLVSPSKYLFAPVAAV